MSREIKYVIIPQTDIDALEKARIRLHHLSEGKIDKSKKLEITEKMWKITHKKYPEYKKNIEE